MDQDLQLMGQEADGYGVLGPGRGPPPETPG
jgi:hypothetical protein